MGLDIAQTHACFLRVCFTTAPFKHHLKSALLLATKERAIQADFALILKSVVITQTCNKLCISNYNENVLEKSSSTAALFWH